MKRIILDLEINFDLTLNEPKELYCKWMTPKDPFWLK